jgi:hypothetical protein
MSISDEESGNKSSDEHSGDESFDEDSGKESSDEDSINESSVEDSSNENSREDFRNESSDEDSGYESSDEDSGDESSEEDSGDESSDEEAVFRPTLSVLGEQDRNIVLNKHNRLRDEAEVPRLIWSDTLAQSAFDHAMTVLRSRRELSYREQNSLGHIKGENIYVCADGAYTFEQMIVHWGKCRGLIDPETGLSRNGRNVSRYKEMIHRDSREIGAAHLTDSGGSEYFVCHYR